MEKSAASLPSVPRPPPPVFEVLTDLAALEALRPAWEELFARSAGALLFQAHGWVCAWLRHVPLGRPRVLVARRGERLTAVIPLCVEDKGFAPVQLRIVRTTSPFADFADVLSDPQHPEDLAQLWALQLWSPGWNVADLQFTREGSHLARLAQATWGPFLSTTQPQGVAPYIDLTRDWKESVPSSRRSEWLRRRRRLAEQGRLALTTASTPQEVAERVEEFADLHVARWNAKGVGSDYRSPRFRAFLREVCLSQLTAGRLRLYRLALDEATVALGVYFLFGRHLFPYSYTFAAEFSKCSPLHQLILHVVEQAQEQGLADVHDFGAGAEPYKLLWTDRAVRLSRTLIARPTASGRAALWWAADRKAFLERHPALAHALALAHVRDRPAARSPVES